VTSASQAEVDLRVSFPFGRYAAIPWFRSRREHVGNVEWPPSPWRVARGLVAVAARHHHAERLEEVVALVRALAGQRPSYRLPIARPLTYTQWMPRLDFGDGLGSDERLDNGHSLLDVAPDEELMMRWTALALDETQRALLEELLDDLPYLGQSVSVCEARLAVPGEPDHGRAVLEAVASTEAPAESQRALRLLCPKATVSLDELSLDTAPGAVRSMPAPPGSEWVDFLVEQPSLSRPVPTQPRATGAHLRLTGILRPTVARPEDPLVEASDAVVHRQLDKRLGHLADMRLLDDDGDGRAERVAIRFATPRAVSELGSALAGFSLREGNPQAPRIDCLVDVEELAWGGAVFAPGEELVNEPLCFVLRSRRAPLLADAIVVAEAFHRRLLGVAGARFGRTAIPPRLSGREAGGGRLRNDHRHAHILAGSEDGTTVSHLMVWARDGFTSSEAAAIGAVTLPALSGAAIELRQSQGHPSLGTSLRWRTVTPFLPVRHPKHRRGELRHGVADQVRAELAARGLPVPSAIRLPERDWSAFRTVRTTRDGSRPGLGAHAVELEFDHPVSGPLALGANAHFSMGLFVPVA